MEQPWVGDTFAALPDTHVIPTYWPVPGLGTIPMNAFLLRSAEPVLVDSGVEILDEEFLDALGSLIDPVDIRWIWLTHEDRDHTGALRRLLEMAPRATVLGTFMTFGRAAPDGWLPPDRTRIVNPGDTVSVGDRELHAVRPPLFDSPGTLGFLDGTTGAYVASDCFGAPLSADVVATDSADAVDADTLREAQITWATVDSPWVVDTDRARLSGHVDAVRNLDPSVLLSSHLPPVQRRVGHSLESVVAAQGAELAPGLTQEQLESLLGEFAPAGVE
ncbi:MAG: MBL fold metallo-hydrolase [Actinomycetota bacterium]|nr:MBL fold metallo-hydrolase [Actinomycetota bacterium]